MGGGGGFAGGGPGVGDVASSSVSREIAKVSFSFYSPNDIRAMSVKQISNPLLLDSFGRPTYGGLYDPALGPMDFKSENCSTCHLSFQACPGHFGHIELAAPCYNPVTFRLLYKLLQSLCYYCHKLRSPRLQVHHFIAKMILVRAGLIVDSLALDDIIATKPPAKVSKTNGRKKRKGSGVEKRESMVDDEALDVDDDDDDDDENDGDGDPQDDDDILEGENTLEQHLLSQPRTPEDMMAKIEEYLSLKLSEAGLSDPSAQAQLLLNPPKSTLITDTLLKLQRQFFASIPPNACGNCRGVSPKFRKEGVHKVFEKALSAKNASAMRARQKEFERLFSSAGREMLKEIEEKRLQRRRDGLSEGDDTGESDSENDDNIKTNADAATAIAQQIQAARIHLQSSGDNKSSDSDDQDDDFNFDSNENSNIGGLKELSKKSARRAEKQAQLMEEEAEIAGDDKARYLSSMEVRAHINLLWIRERRLLDTIFGNSVESPLSNSHDSRRCGDKKSSSSTTVMDFFYNRRSSPDIFFLEVMPVTPVRFRPASKMGDMLFEDPQNTYLSEILKTNTYIRELRSDQLRIAEQQQQQLQPKAMTSAALPRRPGQPDPTIEDRLAQIVQSCVRLQEQVNVYLDSAKSTQPLKGGKEPPPGVRQLLEKKEGLFRKHMMGKRVNFAARSVISPDPYIEANEIGVPPPFAIKLTYPEPVTSHSFQRLRQAVINGPKKWPGASAVVNEDGQVLSLEALDESARTAIANQLLTPSISGDDAARVPHSNKKVLRHIRDGDFVIMNRQPTLHKPSMMAHTTRILPGEKTIRMHYANCNTYNADFDGDEMNMHFPQNDIARAEAMLIARTDQQYLVPTDGGVLRGLIQDHVDAGVHMCSRDTFLEEEDYIQLVCASLKSEARGGTAALRNGNIEAALEIGDKGRIQTVAPALFKPKRLWTGKQVITTILINLAYSKPRVNLSSKCRVPAKYWGKTAAEDSHVIIMNSCLLTGILDKSQLGASAHGLVHAVYELHGPAYASALLSTLGRLLTSYLQLVGFTCRMDDLLLTSEGDKIRRRLIDGSKTSGRDATLAHFGIKRRAAQSEVQRSVDDDEDGLDPATAAELRAAMEASLRDNDKAAALDGSMRSATHGLTSSVISSTIPDHIYRIFPHNNMQLMTVSGAKGSGVNVSQISCCLGQQELEGRRVPTMVSGKTLPSFKAFDPSIRAGGYVAGRFLTGIKPQEYFFHCMAGREGLIDTAVKTSRSGYLQRCLIKHLEGLRVHYDHTVRDSDGSVLQFLYGEDGLDVVKRRAMDDISFCAMNYRALASRLNAQQMAEAGGIDSEAAGKFIKRRNKVLEKVAAGEADASSVPDPVISTLVPSRFLGSVSEKFNDCIDAFISENKNNLLERKKKKSDHKEGTANKCERPQTSWSGGSPVSGRLFKFLMNLKYLHSLVEPGEAVGLLAAQSVGEPSTQMTLNTFHFAGFGAKNVTLGIPRLREIIMTASASIKTPLMRLPLRPNVSMAEGEKLAKKLSRLTLSNIMESVTVREKMIKSGGLRKKLLTIRLVLWPKQDLMSEHTLTPRTVFETVEKTFSIALDKAVSKLIKPQRSSNLSQDTVNDDDTKKRRSGSYSKSSRSSESGEDLIGVALGSFDAGRSRRSGNDSDGEDGVGFNADRRRVKRTGGGDSEDEDEDGRGDEEGGAEDAQAAKRLGKGLNNYDEPDEDEENENADDDEAEEVNAEDDECNERLANKTRYVVGFRRDVHYGRWCELDMEFAASTRKILMVAVVESVTKTVVIHEVAGIKKCYPLPKESESDNTNNLGTEGVNLKGVWDYPEILDLTNIYTNDVAAILRTYGVEAARAAIMSEIASVFGVYGISVDRRHLSLISDYMTFEGGYKAFNRIGMNSNPSPFAQMSFETTSNFLTAATLAGDIDPLESPSARIVLGKVVRGGTGAFDVLSPRTVNNSGPMTLPGPKGIRRKPWIMKNQVVLH